MPRSGTTLLSSILDSHPGIAISPETHFYTRCVPSAVDREEAVEEVWHCLQQQPGIQDMAFCDDEVEAIRRRVQSMDAPTPADLFRAVEGTYADRFGAEAWGEKTPDHLAHVPAIFEDFPSARVLAIVRDPRDVCLSLQNMPWSRDSLPESAWKWRRYARATEEYQTTYSERFREIRYEALLETPETVIRGILDWLNAPFDEAVLSFHREGEGPVDPDREPWKKKVQRPLDPGNKEKWRDQMAPGPRLLVEWIVGDELTRKTYEHSETPFDVGASVSVAWALLRAGQTVVRRMWRQWQMPDRAEEDHTPVWMRQRDIIGEDAE